jgi:hypothetical protein
MVKELSESEALAPNIARLKLSFPKKATSFTISLRKNEMIPLYNYGALETHPTETPCKLIGKKIP